MHKILIILVLLSTGLILAGCSSNLPKAADSGIVNSSHIETFHQRTGSGSPANIATANKTITWNTSDNGSSGQQAKPDLSGHWILNKELSDNPQERIKAALQQARNTKGESSSGRGGRRSGQDSSFHKLQALLSASETLILTHKDPMLLIVTDEGRKQWISTDNRGASISANGGMQQKVTTAGWEQDILIVETTSDSGPQLIQQFKLITEMHQLLVSTAIQLPESSKAILINRVYKLANIGTDTTKRTIISTGN
jgi:hypothetical protein